LILAGGGYVASSWEIGLIAGFAEAGLEVRNADLIVGTSAGARVALDLVGGEPIETIYSRRAEPRPAGPAEPSTPIDWARIRSSVDAARAAGGSTADILRRYGNLAIEVASPSKPDRRTAVAAQLPLQAWPDRRVLITAVNAETGERRAFDAHSGIDLVDAMIATTASFGAPPVWFDGHHYIDGGYHSSDNADLAVGYDRVLVLALRSPPQAMRLVSVETGVETLRAAGAEVEVIHPDEATLAALAPTGGQMNPASGAPAAIAGRAQGRHCATQLISFWH
jgi:NTE family protein